MKPSVQWLRHAVRLAILALVVLIPLLAAHRTSRPTIGSGEPGMSAQVAQQVRGNTWALEIGPLSLIDPLAGLESLVSGKVVVAALLIGLAIPVLVSLVAGRLFCSWVCPVGLLLEGTDRLRPAVEKLGVRSRNMVFWRGNKYAILAVGLGLSALLAVPVMGRFYPPAVLVGEVHRWSYGLFAVGGSDDVPFLVGGLTWGTAFIAGIALFELFVSRRMLCRYFCPGGALYSLLGARRRQRLALPESQCDRCGDCVPACGMGLNPMNGITGLECDNCLACVSACPLKALHSTFSFTEARSATEGESAGEVLQRPKVGQ